MYYNIHIIYIIYVCVCVSVCVSVTLHCFFPSCMYYPS